MFEEYEKLDKRYTRSNDLNQEDMAFWGTIISSKNSYSHCDHDHHSRLRITQAALGLTSNDNLSREKVVVVCEHERKNRFPLCVLIPGSVESQCLALEVEVKEDVKFSVIGTHKVSLSGYFYSGHERFTINEDKSRKVGEDIPDSESKDIDDSEDDDYDYEDSFIVDDRDRRGSGKRQTSKQQSCSRVEAINKKEKASSTSMKPFVKPEAVWRKQLTPKFEL